MNKVMPAEVALGSEFKAELHLTAMACAANVVVRDTVPAGASYVSSEPAATVDGDQLVWKLGNMEAGESKTIELTLRADKENTLVNCASVSADPRTCAATRVVKPAIQLTKTEPSDVTICDPIPITLVVKNNGSSRLTGVKVSDSLPTGLTSDGKSSLAFDVGSLNPSESKEIKFNAVAAKPGKYNNLAKATCDQRVSADASAATTVHQAVLALTCKAREQQYLGRPFDVCFTVSNSGDAAAAASQVVVTLPGGLTVASTTANGRVSGNTIVWDVGSLAPNAPKELCATFTSATAGTFGFNGTAKGVCAAQVSSSCQTKVVGIPAILLEKWDDPDPVAIGETTTYTARITNQGSADDTNVRLVVTIAPELAPVSSPDGAIDGQTVTFPVVPRLAPKAAVTFKVVAKGVKAGDGHTKFTLTSDMLSSPVLAEESTHVY
jgi:uncharacterized repeat protein (TIGR01451 family)